MQNDFAPFTKIHSKWITNLKMQNTKISKRKQENPHDLGFGDEFFTVSTVWSIKNKTDKLDFTKTKHCALQKTLLRKWKQSYLLKYLCTKYTKNLYNSTISQQTAQFKNGQEVWTGTSAKKIYKGQVYKKMLNVSPPAYHYILIRMAKINLTTPIAGENV